MYEGELDDEGKPCGVGIAKILVEGSTCALKTRSGTWLDGEIHGISKSITHVKASVLIQMDLGVFKNNYGTIHVNEYKRG